MSMQRLVLILFLSLTLCNALIGRSNGGLKSVSEVVTNLRSYPVLHLLPDLSPLAQDTTVSGVAIGGTLLWLQVWITLTKKGVIESKLSRKIIHSGSAPIFMLLWPLYSTSPSAKYIASSVVAIQAGRLILAGLRSGSDKEGESKSNYGVVATNSLNKDTSSSPSQADGSSGSRSGIVGAISRSGSKKEALQGPLIYTIMLFLGTLLWFRDSPIGVVGMYLTFLLSHPSLITIPVTIVIILTSASLPPLSIHTLIIFSFLLHLTLTIYVYL